MTPARPSPPPVSSVVARPGYPVDVTVLEWPEEHELRRWLSDRRLPRILVVVSEGSPPSVLDDLEDWVRAPVRPGDLEARAEALLRRGMARLEASPMLDADGLLRYGGRWVAIPDGQIEAVRLLLDNLGRVVPTGALRSTYVAAGGSGHPNSMRTLIARLNRRIRSVGLYLETIRGRGVLLASTPSSEA